MSRPRIRTIKPEAQQDERVGALSRDARLLFFAGLVTMADDEGRLRAMPTLILGHTFPYDEDATPAKLARWLGEIEREGLILRYEHGGRPYIAIRHFRRHQRIDKPNSSILPPPPDPGVVADNSKNGTGDVADESTNDRGGVADEHRPSRARGGSDRIGSGTEDPQTPTGEISEDTPPDDFPDELRAALPRVVAVLGRIAAVRGANAVTVAATARAMASYPRRPHLKAAEDLEHWLVYGTGKRNKVRDVVAYFRNQLDRRWEDQARPAAARSASSRDIAAQLHRSPSPESAA
jgi:hypothetical protein